MTTLETLRAALRAYDLSGPLTKERNQATHDVINAARTLALSGTPETPTRRNRGKLERLAMQYGWGRPTPEQVLPPTEAEAQEMVDTYRTAYPPTVFGMGFAAIEARRSSIGPGFCGDPYVHECGRLDCPASDSYRSP